MSVRFAPSPTGTFHIGNLRTAWISAWWAKQLGQPWVVRFEDIDTPRVVAGSQERQLHDLKSLGLTPDQIVIQSQRRQRHWQLFQQAQQSGALYPCQCSRKEILSSLASAPHGHEAVYSGHCRNQHPNSKATTLAWRFKEADVSGRDDFIVARTDFQLSESSFVPAYHWACAIDDLDGGYQLLVRAYDLKSAATTQRKIQKWIQGSQTDLYPAIYHTSLVTTDQGGRLEKRTRGVTLEELSTEGINVESLLSIFQTSFMESSASLQPEKIWGESKESISLKDLGLPQKNSTVP